MKLEKRKKWPLAMIALCLFLVLCLCCRRHLRVYIESKQRPPTASFVPSNLYQIENEKFSIQSNGTNARATTDGINKAIQWAKSEGYQGVSLSAGTYLIQCQWGDPYTLPDDGIRVPSDTVLDLSGAVLKLETNSRPAYNLIYTIGGSNITINGGHLIGDKDSHIYSGETLPTHEWGCGVNIAAGANVTVQNMEIEKMTGDAVTIRGGSGKNSRGITVSNNILHDCRRQGISITGCLEGVISKNVIYNVKGTRPEYGIDIEANPGYDVRNMLIEENVISTCRGGSVLFYNGADNVASGNTCIAGNIVVGGKTKNTKIVGNIMKDSILGIKKGAVGVYMADNILEGNSVLIEEP